jgi:hypothetical protein
MDDDGGGEVEAAPMTVMRPPGVSDASPGAATATGFARTPPASVGDRVADRAEASPATTPARRRCSDATVSASTASL